MTKRKTYDVAIIGLGTMGSFAAVELARRGLSVIGLDQFTPPHGRGSHSGNTRIYRVAYPEGSGYVPLTQAAGALWDQAAEQLGRKLLHRTGVLYMGPPGETFLREVADSASTHHLEVESLTAEEVHRRYPAFKIPDNYAGLLDVQAGWLDVDASITSSLAFAQSLGVECLFDQLVKGWDANQQEVHVHLEKESITAARLIVTAGAWAGALLRDLQLPLAIKRKVVAWFNPLAPELFAPDRVPVFAFPENFTYGFPNLAGLGVRLAEHIGGDYLPDADSPVSPPGPADLNPLAAIAARYLPGLAGTYEQARSRITHSAICLYTMTPDEDFIVDHHPKFKNVIFAAGFSGHGFKFAPLIAGALADLALLGKTEWPIGFLSLNRLSKDGSSRW
jgi:monomeric sarcosine oxidase